MEHLHLNDAPPGQGGSPLPPPPQGPPGGPMLGRPPPPPQQLPAQMFTTAAQLLDLTDSKPAPASPSRRLLSTHTGANLVIREAYACLARRTEDDGRTT